MSVRDAYIGGHPRYMLTIEGVQDIWVSDVSLAGTFGDRRILAGLVLDGAVLEERSLLREGTLDVSPLSLGIVSPAADRVFGREARIRATLMDSVSVSDTVWTVASTVSLAADDYLHVATECVQVVSVDGPDEITVLRARNGSSAQAHFVGSVNGVGTNVHLFDEPTTMQGRRAFLRVYEQDGTTWSVAWMGRVSSHPYLRADCVTWQIDLDPITALLDQTIGGLIGGEDVPAFGVAYTAATPFYFAIKYTTDSVTYEYNFVIVDDVYASDEGFLAALADEIEDMAPTGVTLTFGRNEWLQLTVTVTAGANNVTGLWCVFGSVVDGMATMSMFRPDGFSVATTESIVFRVDHVPANLLGMNASQLFGDVRGVVGEFDTDVTRFISGSGLEVPDADASDDGSWRIYVDSDFGSSLTGATAEFHDVLIAGQRSVVRVRVVLSASSGSQTVLDLDRVLTRVDGDPPTSAYFFYDERSRVSFRFSYGEGTWRDLLATLIADGPNANAGGGPHLLSDDFDTRDRTLSTAIAHRAATITRQFDVTEEASITEWLSPLLLATGCMMRLGSQGQIGFAPMVSPADAQSVFTIDDAAIVTPGLGAGSWPTQRPTNEGVVSQVVIKDGERTVSVRDEGAVARYRNRGAGDLDLDLPGIALAPIGPTEAFAIASPLLAFFARALTEITVTVGYAARNVLVGDVVTLVSSHVVDAMTGVRGTTAPCIVIGRRWPLDPAEGASGELTLLRAPANVAGYAPCALIAGAEVVDEDNNIVDLTLSDNEFTDEDVDNDWRHFAAGDGVRLHAGEGGFLARTSVVSMMGNLMRVVLDTDAPDLDDGTPVFFGVELLDESAGMTANMRRYVYIADDAGEFDGQPGRVFG